MSKKISGGVAHDMPADLQKAIVSNPNALEAWESLTPLSRNEWICWTISVKKEETRKEHVSRVVSELTEGIRRPCCWVGCVHRSDKQMSRSQKWALSKKSKNKTARKP
jgi:hypothetical protein